MIQARCPSCNKESAIMHRTYGITIGKKCLAVSRNEETAREFERRKGLTEYQRLKLSWYRDEKKWHENIRMRQLIKTPGGEKVPVLVRDNGTITGRMPSPRDRY